MKSFRSDKTLHSDASPDRLVRLFQSETAEIMEAPEPWGVPLMVTRGYASLSFLNSAAETIEAVAKAAYLYYFGDWDPSGVDILKQAR